MKYPIDKFILFQKDMKYRWKLQKKSGSPSIFIRDSWEPSNRISLKPLRIDSLDDCQKVWDQVQLIGDQVWCSNYGQKEKHNPWKHESEKLRKYLNQRNKQSTNKNYFACLNELERRNIAQTKKAIKDWLYEREIGTKPFLTRLEFLRQLQNYYCSIAGNFPSWFTNDEYHLYRRFHNNDSKKQTKNLKDQQGIQARAIVTKETMEEYLDQNIEEFPWQCWSLAMMMAYGLRNHELWYIQKRRNSFISVPGILTKSPVDHLVWPAFQLWLEKYKLFENFETNQKYLRSKVKPIITSATKPSVFYEVTEKAAGWDGIGQNNDKLGEFITRRTLGNVRGKPGPMPPLLADSTVTRGKKIQARPYDLRHTWAVTMMSDPGFGHLSDEKCAKAMGHGVDVHRKRYQLWANKKKIDEDFTDSFTHPYAA